MRVYLSPEHRDALGAGCPIAAWAPEVARHPRATRDTLATELEPTLDLLAEVLSEKRGKKARADSTALLGLMAGTLQLARATPNRAESDALLQASVRAALRRANDDEDARERRSFRASQ